MTGREFAPEITTEVDDNTYDEEVGDSNAAYEEDAKCKVANGDTDDIVHQKDHSKDELEDRVGVGGASASTGAFTEGLSSRFAESWAEWKRSRLLESWRTWKADGRREKLVKIALIGIKIVSVI